MTSTRPEVPSIAFSSGLGLAPCSPADYRYRIAARPPDIAFGAQEWPKEIGNDRGAVSPPFVAATGTSGIRDGPNGICRCRT
jgi:hypothetical protein